MREICESYVKKMMFFKRSQYQSRSILEVILGRPGIIFEDSELKIWARFEIWEFTKSGPKTQENEKNEVLKIKFSQPTLKNY